MNPANFAEMDQGRIKGRRGPHPVRGPAVARMWLSALAPVPGFESTD
jgi:hypothetical protein